MTDPLIVATLVEADAVSAAVAARVATPDEVAEAARVVDEQLAASRDRLDSIDRRLAQLAKER